MAVWMRNGANQIWKGQCFDSDVVVGGEESEEDE